MNATHKEWITTAEAAEVLGIKNAGSTTLELRRFGVASRGNGPPAPCLWSFADVVAMRDLRRERADAKAARMSERAAKRANSPEQIYIRPSRAMKTRPCMCCSTPFASEGPHNRLCPTCRRGGGFEDHAIPRGRE